MTLAARVTAQVVRPVVLIYLNFNGDVLRGWTGPGDLVIPGGQTGDSDLDGNTFLSADGKAVNISPISESWNGTAPVTITYSAKDVTQEVIRQVIGTPVVWQLRRACLWVGFLLDNPSSTSTPFTNLVHPEIQRVFTGVMVSAKMREKPHDASVIEMTIDTDLGKATGIPLRITDHQRIWSGDTWSTWIPRLAQGKIVGARKGASGGSATTGFGPGGRGGGLGVIQNLQ